MATFYLVNGFATSAGGAGARRLFPGTVVDSTQLSVAALIAAGAELWPTSASAIATAAARVTSLRLSQGINEEQAASVMRSGVAQQLESDESGAGWQTKTAAFTVDPTTARHYNINTTGGAFAGALPTTGLVVGDSYFFVDSALNFGVAAFTVNAGSNVIEQLAGGTAATLVLAITGTASGVEWTGALWKLI